MEQATFDDDDLFGEAADELRTKVVDGIDDTWSALPAAEAVWEVKADNVLGVLNALRSTLDIEDARTAFRDAKKWYTMGERADAFETGDNLGEELERIEETIGQIEEIRAATGQLTSGLPRLREALPSGDTPTLVEADD